MNDKWQLADASVERESSERSSSPESDDERPVKRKAPAPAAQPPAKAPRASPAAQPPAKAAAPAAQTPAKAAAPAAQPPAKAAAPDPLLKITDNESGFCYFCFGETTRGCQHDPVRGSDTAFSYEVSQKAMLL